MILFTADYVNMACPTRPNQCRLSFSFWAGRVESWPVGGVLKVGTPPEVLSPIYPAYSKVLEYWFLLTHTPRIPVLSKLAGDPMPYWARHTRKRGVHPLPEG